MVIGHYNADERSFVPATVQESVNVTEQMTISTVCKGIHEGMKTKAYYLIDYLNYTTGNYSLMFLRYSLRVHEKIAYFHSDPSISHSPVHLTFYSSNNPEKIYSSFHKNIKQHNYFIYSQYYYFYCNIRSNKCSHSEHKILIKKHKPLKWLIIVLLVNCCDSNSIDVS